MNAALNAVVGNWEVAGNYRYESGHISASPEWSRRTQRRRRSATSVPATSGSTRLGSGRCRRSRAAQIRGSTTNSRDRTIRTSTSHSRSAFRSRGTTRLNFRIEAYNLLNGMNWANPNTTIGASDFGQVLRQADAYFGRQLQYTLRVEF